MTLQVKTIGPDGMEFWDKSIVKFPHAHPFNAYNWGRVREIDGWEPLYFVAMDGDIVRGMIMVLHKKIPWSGYSILYAPKGPVTDLNDHKAIKCIVEKVREEGRKRRSIFLRIEPNIPEDSFINSMNPFLELGFVHLENRWSFWNSPRDVYRIDLNNFHSEEDIFQSMDRDTRRCIRKSAKEGVVITPAKSKDDLQIFYKIFKKFSIEKKFLSRDYKYQLALWNEFVARGNGRLFLACYEGKIIGGLICLTFGGKCIAMHMGTPPQYNRLHTYYAYVWESIRWAKENNCVLYSFRGVGSTPTQEKFKRKFNPHIVSLLGYYDLPLLPWLYPTFCFAELNLLPKMVLIYKAIRKKSL